MKQTAVEFLVNSLNNYDSKMIELFNKEIEQAIELEKQQMRDCFLAGDDAMFHGVSKTIEDWDEFFASDEVYSTERNTNDFKQIQAVYESYKAYLTFLNIPYTLTTSGVFSTQSTKKN